MLLEHVIMCRLIMGKKTEALGEMAQMASLLSSDTRLQGLHDAQLHTLLGLYAMSMNCMDSAETQVCGMGRNGLFCSHSIAQLRFLWVYLRLRRFCTGVYRIFF